MAEWSPLLAPEPLPGSRPGPRPRTSVLIPAYNAAETIGDALESALTQHPAPDEVVVSDDGSQDDLASALKPFSGRITVVRGPNGGLAVARNRAAEVATGELLCLLDADDVWLPGRVGELQHAAASRPDLSVITTDAIESRAGEMSPTTYYGIRTFDTEHQEVAILRDNFIFGAGSIRASAFWAVGGYRPGLRHAEDWDLWTRLLLAGHRAGMVDRPLYEYRRRAESLTGDSVGLGLAVLDLLDRTDRPGLSAEQRRQLRRTRQAWRETVASVSYRTGDVRGRRSALLAAAGAGVRPADRLRLAAKAAVPRRWLGIGAGGR